MMQDAGANDQIELLVQVGGVLDRQVARFEIRQVILLLQRCRVFETRVAHVDRRDARLRMTKRKLRRLPGAAARHEYIEISRDTPGAATADETRRDERTGPATCRAHGRGPRRAAGKDVLCRTRGSDPLR